MKISSAISRRLCWLLNLMLVSLMLTGCGYIQSNQIQTSIREILEVGSKIVPRVSAESRIFLNLSLDFLGEYRLPKTTFADTPVGGLSALSYDRQRSMDLMPLGFRVYALSDDRSDLSPARFYTLKVMLEPQDNSGSQLAPDNQQVTLKRVEVEQVTFLKAENGEPYAKGTIDPEGIALTSERSVFVSSEGVTNNGVLPFINEFDLVTGALRQVLPLPKRYIADASGAEQTVGIRDNLGFEALTLNPVNSGTFRTEPFRVFAATEAALKQDLDADSQTGEKGRLLHYLIGDGPPVLISEHLYPIEPPPPGAEINGLTELLSLDQGGHFLSLERSYGAIGIGARIFQAATGGATDISSIPSLKGPLSGILPVRKKLLLDLDNLGIRLDNLEGMTLGPQLPDGSRSLLLVSDNNFSAKQITQFLLFRLKIAA